MELKKRRSGLRGASPQDAPRIVHGEDHKIGGDARRDRQPIELLPVDFADFLHGSVQLVGERRDGFVVILL